MPPYIHRWNNWAKLWQSNQHASIILSFFSFCRRKKEQKNKRYRRNNLMLRIRFVRFHLKFYWPSEKKKSNHNSFLGSLLLAINRLIETSRSEFQRCCSFKHRGALECIFRKVRNSHMKHFTTKTVYNFEIWFLAKILS